MLSWVKAHGAAVTIHACVGPANKSSLLTPFHVCIADECCIGACLRAALPSLCAEGRVWAANLVKGHWNGGQG